MHCGRFTGISVGQSFGSWSRVSARTRRVEPQGRSPWPSWRICRASARSSWSSRKRARGCAAYRRSRSLTAALFWLWISQVGSPTWRWRLSTRSKRHRDIAGKARNSCRFAISYASGAVTLDSPFVPRTSSSSTARPAPNGGHSPRCTRSGAPPRRMFIGTGCEGAREHDGCVVRGFRTPHGHAARHSPQARSSARRTCQWAWRGWPPCTPRTPRRLREKDSPASGRRAILGHPGEAGRS